MTASAAPAPAVLPTAAQAALMIAVMRCSFPGYWWRWRILKTDTPEDDGLLVWAVFRDRFGEEWTTRKWYLSPHATDSEVAQTMLKLVLTSVEHEAREAFTYQHKAIYGPHFKATDLMRLNEEHRPHDHTLALDDYTEVERAMHDQIVSGTVLVVPGGNPGHSSPVVLREAP